MCMYCHRDDPAFDTDPNATYESVHAAAHGDGNSACLRVVETLDPSNEHYNSSYVDSKGQSWRCVDCGELVRAMDVDDHCCYTDA